MFVLFSSAAGRWPTRGRLLPGRLGACLLAGAFIVFLALAAASARAATVLGVVSERAAPAAAEAAREVLASRPADRIVLRTPGQIQALEAGELRRLVEGADAVLAVAVFGEPANRLARALIDARRRPARIAAFHGDAVLTRLSRGTAGDLAAVPEEILSVLSDDPPAEVLARGAGHPPAAEWLAWRGLWREGGNANIATLLDHLLEPRAVPPRPHPQPELRLRQQGREVKAFSLGARPTVAVLDLSTSGTAPADAICAETRRRGLDCVAVFARWGQASREAVGRLPGLLAPAPMAGLVVLQDFVVGGADGREEVTEHFSRLDVPVIKAIRLTDRSAAEWRLSRDGLPAASVQYRLAMPELQGTGQPLVVAAAGSPRIDRLTGVELRAPEPIVPELQALAERLVRWQALRSKPNHEKRVAIIYYNHPPGRQNVGADNLDVPASLMSILAALEEAGYTLDGRPQDAAALLDGIMERGVSLPEDGAALRELADRTRTMSAAEYRRWFAGLPERARLEVSEGPLGRLHAEVGEALAARKPELARALAEHTLGELRHLVAGMDHPGRAAALELLDRLGKAYAACAEAAERNGAWTCPQAVPLKAELAALGIPGLRGWGEAPGWVMVQDGGIVLPGLQFGNVFIGPQPPRGWEVDEELLHANTSIAPPHQYLAYYHWLRDVFKADAIVHLGRHSTYEFLPGKGAGLAAHDFPRLIAGDVPGLYPYIVDGVGEGTQAKRRGLAVIVDHLTPPLAATPLYDRLLALRQIVESYESGTGAAMRNEAAREMRAEVEALQLRSELEASMADVLAVRGIGFEETDDDLLAHEIGHYLTKLQEKFMPHGLHVFGEQWEAHALDTMLDSMARVGTEGKDEDSTGGDDALRERLRASPAAELAGLLRGLEGGFVPPGKGNDPLRAPEALPTGRNFHALDGDLLPTRLGYRLGAAQAARTRGTAGEAAEGSEGVILWASDAVRDEGVMVAFALALMGAEPEWNARGIVGGVRLLPADEAAPRRDVIVTTSGLFRDLYPNLIGLVDRAGRLALAAGAASIVEAQPELRAALGAALAPLGEDVQWGRESLAANAVAREWMTRAGALQAQGHDAERAGREAAWRIFGDAPGAYGAGVNRLAERSGAWRSRDEIGRAYRLRMGHAYGLDAHGDAAHAAFDEGVSRLAHTYHGRASHLYGLLDNNDAFDYLGGLSLAAETLTGRVPRARVLMNADPRRAGVEALETALLGELRGRFLNPAFIRPLMAHGYAGARSFGQEFLENLWGWQVTRPDVVRDWAWEEVKRVYLDDAHELGLPDFLEQGHNAHVKAQMLAIMLVAVEKGFWNADADTVRRLGGELVELVSANGLPGSGHTAPDHPMWAWLAPQLEPQQARALGATLARARGEDPAPSPLASQTGAEPDAATAPESPQRWHELERAATPAVRWPLVLLGVAVLLGWGIWRGACPHTPAVTETCPRGGA